MAYCGPRGIPLSVFLSWSVDDQNAALAWQTREQQRCPDCGTHPDEWDPAKGGSHTAYHVKESICEGCVELERAREQPDMKDPLRGLHLHLIPRR